jgi:hypothetical protein
MPQIRSVISCGIGPWTGAVEIFTVKRHPKASQAFAWALDDRGEIVTKCSSAFHPSIHPALPFSPPSPGTPHAGSIPHEFLH